MYDVTALGELLIDFAPVSADAEGYPTIAAKPGGAPANFLAALSAYGAKTAFIGKVGADVFGELLIRTLKKAGIETRGVAADPSVFTTLAFVTLDGAGNRSFSFARKPGADTCLRFGEVDISLIDEARIFHFGTLSLTGQPARETTQAAVRRAKNGGKWISFDPNLRLSLWPSPGEAKDRILWGLGQADIVKISDEEVDFLWGCDGEEGARKLLEEFGVKLAMVTLGPGGALLMNKNARAFAPCPSVTPADTTGAGDIFGGSALSRVLKLGMAPEDLGENELREIAAFATTAASLSTEKTGGIPSIPAEEEINRMIPIRHGEDRAEGC